MVLAMVGLLEFTKGLLKMRTRLKENPLSTVTFSFLERQKCGVPEWVRKPRAAEAACGVQLPVCKMGADRVFFLCFVQWLGIYGFTVVEL